MLSNGQLRDYTEFEVLFKTVKDMRDDIKFAVNEDMQRECVERRPVYDENGAKIGSVSCVMDVPTEKSRAQVVDRAAFSAWIVCNADSLLTDDVAEAVLRYTGEVPDGCEVVVERGVKKGYVRAYPTKEYRAELEARAQRLLDGGPDAG